MPIAADGAFSMSFEFNKLSIPEVVLITPGVYGDERGFFLESYRESEFRKNGIVSHFNQQNHSCSTRGVLRGLHYQLAPMAQGKLVRVAKGVVYDVAVDIRKGSPTYGKYVGATLSATNHAMLWVPPGFAHGFVALEDDTHFLYNVTNEYSPQHERGIRYDDPSIGIEWPIPSAERTVSPRDLALPLFPESESNFQYET